MEPDPVALALLAERAGADGITVHLREDRRHIQERDVWRLRESIATRLNLEMACTPAMIEFALKLKPDSVCLVPENRRGGHHRGRPRRGREPGSGARGDRRDARRRASPPASSSARTRRRSRSPPACDSPWIELHTGAYAEACHTPARARPSSSGCGAAAALAHQLGLVVNAGHGINYVNIAEVRTLPHLHELNIGHSILSRAVFTGIEEAVREMKARMSLET